MISRFRNVCFLTQLVPLQRGADHVRRVAQRPAPQPRGRRRRRRAAVQRSIPEKVPGDSDAADEADVVEVGLHTLSPGCQIALWTSLSVCYKLEFLLQNNVVECANPRQRVVLDEAQEVESSTAKAAAMARLVPAVHRWAVTGTPVSRGLEDLQGLFAFLGGPSPLTDAAWWR
jgi:hypothetical protein